MRRTARLMVVILALVVVILAPVGGLLWKGDALEHPDPESPHFSLNPPGWDPDPEYDLELYDLHDLLGGWLLPGEESDGALDVEEGYKMYDDYGW